MVGFLPSVLATSSPPSPVWERNPCPGATAQGPESHPHVTGALAQANPAKTKPFAHVTGSSVCSHAQGPLGTAPSEGICSWGKGADVRCLCWVYGVGVNLSEKTSRAASSQGLESTLSPVDGPESGRQPWLAPGAGRQQPQARTTFRDRPPGGSRPVLQAACRLRAGGPALRCGLGTIGRVVVCVCVHTHVPGVTPGWRPYPTPGLLYSLQSPDLPCVGFSTLLPTLGVSWAPDPSPLERNNRALRALQVFV